MIHQLAQGRVEQVLLVDLPTSGPVQALKVVVQAMRRLLDRHREPLLMAKHLWHDIRNQHAAI